MSDTARTGLGALQGLRQEGLTVFRAVPYAAPPIGPLRFAPPAPVAGWSGERDATVHGPIAPQMPSRLRVAMGDFDRPQSEDCLTLTIWTPSPDAARRPVLFWIHGGAWISGAGSLDWYDGARLAREGDVVVVGVNQRLGALGYLHVPGLAPGNLGTADLTAALGFVRDHIAAFGGDAGRVTVMGQSAGASSIGRLMLDPVARPLFHRAILQSGSFGRPPRTLDEAAALGAQYLDLLGADPRTAEPAALLAAQGAQARANARFGETTPPFMPALPYATSQAGLIADIARAAGDMPILIGATREEVHAFYGADPAMANPDPVLAAERMGDRLEVYRARRPGGTMMDWLADKASDEVFVWPILQLAAAFKGPTWAYRFDWAPPGNRFRACHCIELPFMFGTFDAFGGVGMLEGGDAAAMMALSDRMRAAWLAFVRGGAPATDWPLHEPGRRMTMLLDNVCEPVGDPAGLTTRAGVGS